MKNKVEIQNYIHYKIEDFLKDDFFTASINNPTEESEKFWHEFLQLPNINPSYFLEAKQITQSLIKSYRSSFTPQEVDLLWQKIESGSKGNKHIYLHKRKFIYIGVSIAAAVTLLCLFILPFHKYENSTDSIVAFVENNIKELPNDTAIRLLISEGEILRSDKKEAIIQYDSSQIKMEDDKIEKTKAAKFNQLIVPHGKRSQLLLADGTQIWVNAGTTVTYPVEFTSDQREIYINGEIFLNVTKDPSRPFIVHTHDMNISVLGTSFNVTAYNYEETKRVVLVSGSVKINSHTKEFLLSPNDKYENTGKSENVIQTDISRYISWKDGIYEFESEQLGKVVKNISRYFGKQILCDSEIRNLKCSGKLLIIDDLEKSLQRLCKALPISVYKDDNNQYHLTKRDE